MNRTVSKKLARIADMYCARAPQHVRDQLYRRLKKDYMENRMITSLRVHNVVKVKTTTDELTGQKKVERTPVKQVLQFELGGRWLDVPVITTEVKE